MKVTAEHNERVANLVFGSFFPHYVSKIERKGRTKEELYQVIEWLTGFDKETIDQLVKDKVTVKTFFERASIHPNAHLIKGVICGYRIEEIDNETTRQARYMDKLVDELARGRKMEKILREDKSKVK